MLGVPQRHQPSVPIRKFAMPGSAILRTRESIKTLAKHCFLVWLMVPKSAPEMIHSMAGLRNHHTSRFLSFSTVGVETNGKPDFGGIIRIFFS